MIKDEKQQNNTPITSTQVWAGIGFLLIIITGMVATDLLTKWLKTNKNGKQPEKLVVISDSPQQIVKEVGDVHVAPIVSDKFYPPQDIYTNVNIYNKYLLKVALIGEFDKVELKIHGEVENDLDNLISINVGSVSGILGGYRNDVNSLDLDKTTGIFNKSNPIDFSLNLKEVIKLSTNQNEFVSTFAPTKDQIIWDLIKPPAYTGSGTIANFLIVPLNELGKYGDGVFIDKVELVYTCVGEKDSCKAILCDKSKNYTYGSECLRDNFEKEFGKDSWKNYSGYFSK